MNKIPENIHEGHRGRMRAKLLRHGTSVFETYELLEMLLYNVIPYKDTNPIAKQLMFRFGSVEAVLSASREELMSVSGVGERVADFILTVGSVGKCGYQEKNVSSVCELKFDNHEALRKFLIRYFEDKTENEVIMILMDSSTRVISFEKMYHFDYDSAAVKAKPFMDLAVSKRASAAVIAHNHPNGPVLPSSGDRETNLMIYRSLKAVGVTLLEHFLISGESSFMMMNHISNNFSESIHI